MQYIIPGPQTFPRQELLRYCGMYCIKNIVEHYTSDQRNIVDYAYDGFMRLHGLMFPFHIDRVFRRYGFSPTIHSYRSYAGNEKIEKLKNSLEKGYPVTLLIGHAYYRVGEFSYWKAMLFQHYIVIRGYDNNLEIFYAYDPGKNTVHTPDIPIGNIAISYKDLLRYWNWGGLGVYKNLAVHIDYLL